MEPLIHWDGLGENMDAMPAEKLQNMGEEGSLNGPKGTKCRKYEFCTRNLNCLWLLCQETLWWLGF